MSASFRERNRRRRENRKEKEISREEIEEMMKPSGTTYFFSDLEEGSGASVAMEVDDDNNPFEMMGEAGAGAGAGVGGFLDTKLVDADFFNSFEDDFNDSDIN